MVSEQQYDNAKAERDLAAVALEQAEARLEDTRLTAPYDAVVTRRLVDGFTFIAAGTTVVRIQDLSEVRLAVNAPEALVTRVAQTDIASVEATFPNLPGRTFPLEYREQSTEIDAVTQTYRVVLGMPRPEGANILPGMTASVRVELRDRNDGHGSACRWPRSTRRRRERRSGSTIRRPAPSRPGLSRWTAWATTPRG